MKKCKLHINDKDYLLEMNRNSVKWLEARGFSFTDFDKKPVTYYDLLWESLFQANHKDVNSSLAIKLLGSYEKEKGSEMVGEVIKFAIGEYTAFMNALAGTNSEKNEKKETLEIIED